MQSADISALALPGLQSNFDAAYGGNRAPLPIFVHEPWLKVRGIVGRALERLCSRTLQPLWKCRSLMPVARSEQRGTLPLHCRRAATWQT